MSRFLIVNTDYRGFLAALYAEHSGLENAPYAEQLTARNASLFGVSDFYPRNLAELGHPSIEVSINNRPMQAAWAREHGLRAPAVDAPRLVLRRGIVPWIVRDQSIWMEEVLAAQIEEFRPDVILTHSLSDLRPRFWKRMRKHYRLLAGQIASPLSSDINLAPFDLMLSSLPNFVERFRKAGLHSELFRLAFDPRVLDKVQHREPGADDDPPIAVSFVGSVSRHHAGRLKWLEEVCRQTPVAVWGQGIDSLPKDSAIRRAYRGAAWGIEMFRILRRSRISLNHHIEIAGPYANNMRLYETTGIGALLLTDWKENLVEMFDPGTEVAVYRTSAECVEAIGYYLDHEAERAETARAGHERTLRQHTYRQRMSQLVRIVEGLL
jgi:spore maturation protein CgeB